MIYNVAVILRNIAIGINITRWLISLTDTKTYIHALPFEYQIKSINRIHWGLGLYTSLLTIICIFMLADFNGVGRTVFNIS
jgi:hypothetical protein